MNVRFLTSFVLGVSLLGATAANYTLQIGNVNWSGSAGGYACFSSTAYPNTVNFTITKSVGGRQTYAVTAGPSHNTGTYTRQLNSGGNSLNYALYTTSAMTYQLKAPTIALANEVLSGTVTGQPSQVIPLSFIFYLPPGQVVPPGTYTDQITVSVYPAYNSTGTPDTTQTITFSVVVAAGAAISIVPTGGSFNSSAPQLTLDFGALQAGQTESCDVLIQQNNNCTVNYSSLNNGVMKQIPTPTADQISYTLSALGLNIDLTQPASVPLPSGVSPQPNGNRYPITITIGTLGNPAAGTYQDQITISVVAQ
jgi:spore coat protein U-like protein